MSGHATYDPTTPAGQVRLLISDTDLDDPVFEDAEIEAFLALRSANVLRAAATGLRAIAGNEAQVLKVIRLLDLQTDGAKTADALRQLADDLDKQADEDDGRAKGKFGVAEFAIPPFGTRERLRKQAQRRRGA